VADNNSAADIKTCDQKLYYALATIIVQILCLPGHITQKFRFSASGRQVRDHFSGLQAQGLKVPKSGS
jgi:hypothetical protein